MADRFHVGLSGLQAKHPALVEVRQRGLMMGLKLADPAYGPMLTLAGFHFGLLTIYANHDQSVNQLLPPLTIQENEITASDRVAGPDAHVAGKPLARRNGLVRQADPPVDPSAHGVIEEI